MMLKGKRRTQSIRVRLKECKVRLREREEIHKIYLSGKVKRIVGHSHRFPYEKDNFNNVSL